MPVRIGEHGYCTRKSLLKVQLFCRRETIRPYQGSSTIIDTCCQLSSTALVHLTSDINGLDIYGGTGIPLPSENMVQTQIDFTTDQA